MAISKVYTCVVDVGQGQCTFAILYDNSSPPKIAHTLLFDCGTDSPSPDTAANIDWIAGVLASMATPTIDLLVFSHSDNDHISLMWDLIQAYEGKSTKKLKIPSCWYAGFEDFYTKHGFNILDYLSSYCKKFTTPDFNESQYDSGKHVFDTPPMWISPDGTVQVSMLMGNNIDDQPGIWKLTAFGTVAEKKNRVSIVCALYHGDRSFVICGDATNRTMAWTNYYFGTDYLPNTLMLTLPHHGSRATGLNVSSGQAANAKAIQVVETFAALGRGKTLTASAYAQHSHPSIELINYFTPYATATPIADDTRLAGNSHFAVCHVDEDLQLSSGKWVPQDYQTLTTQSNVYATYYYGGAALFSYPFTTTTTKVKAPAAFTTKKAPAVNAHACWVYLTVAGGGNTMAGYANMAGLTASTPFTTVGAVTATLLGAEPDAPPQRTAFDADTARAPSPHPSLLFADEPAPSQPMVWPARAPALPAGRPFVAALSRLRQFR